MTELKAIRHAGRVAHQHLYRTVEETLRQAPLQPEATSSETLQETLAPNSPTLRQEGDSRTARTRTTSVSHASSVAEQKVNLLLP
jgi:hypothetical protein